MALDWRWRGERPRKGEKGKVSVRPKAMRAAEHSNESTASGGLNAISRDKSHRQQVCQTL